MIEVRDLCKSFTRVVKDENKKNKKNKKTLSKLRKKIFLQLIMYLLQLIKGK